jgi:hypothetical protein
MTRPDLRRRLYAAVAVVGVLTLGACSTEAPDDPGPTATTSPTTTPTTATTTPEPTTQSPTAPPTTPRRSPTTAPQPTTTAPAATPTPDGGDAAALAELLPEGFPLPPELTIIGDPTVTADNVNVAFTVPSGAEAFDFFLAEVPAAGYELQPGTSGEYSPEVASGAILARGNGWDVNLLVVEDDVEITLTRTR